MPSPSLMLTIRKDGFDPGAMTASGLFSIEPDGDRAAMRSQAFRLGERESGGPKPRQRLGIASKHAGALEEIQDRKPRGEPRGTRGGQHMVRPGDVIADGFWRVTAKKHRARMFDGC